MISFRPEVIPFLVASLAAGILIGLLIRACRVRTSRCAISGTIVFLFLAAYMLFFFRDPARVPPEPANAIIAAADGKVAGIEILTPDRFAQAAAFAGLSSNSLARFQGGNVIRFSIFLSLFDVHVNRIPFDGQSTFLGYFPGKHIFTFDEKSSDYNQHNSILVENNSNVCLINQIVGPVCRRVVYWLDKSGPTPVKRGDSFGMMKFGSRLDMYFPEQQVELKVGKGDTVRAGQTIIAYPRLAKP